MGCKPSTLAPQQVKEPAGAPPAAADVEAAAAAPAAAPKGSISQKNLRLRLSSMKPDMKNAFASPRQSVASGYNKLRRGASSLRNAISPSTTPGLTPRCEETPKRHAELHSLARNAIKEADKPACLDIEEAKSQAVASTLHTSMGDRADKEGETEEEIEMLNKEQPTPKQLKAIWLLMKVNAATTPQQTMRWLHDLEWLLVSLDPMERQQPTRSILVEAQALEMCLRNLTRAPDDLQLCVSCLAVLVHLSLAKEASARLTQLGGIEITAKLLKRYFTRCKKLFREIPLMNVIPIDLPDPEAEVQQQEQPQEQLQELNAEEAQEATLAPPQAAEADKPAGEEEMAKESARPATPAPSADTETAAAEEPAPAAAQEPAKAATETAAAAEAAEATAAAAAEPMAPAAASLGAAAGAEGETNAPAAEATNEQAAAAANEQAAAAAAATEQQAAAAPEQQAAPAPAPAPAPETIKTCTGNAQMAALKRACSKLQQQLPLLRQQKAGSSDPPATVSQEQYNLAVKELKLSVEFITLVCRLIFATSLDGDEFAQRWVTTGAPDMAIEALGSQQQAFKDKAFVCWALGALRFLPLAVPSVGEVYVQCKNLLPVAFSRMELHPDDHLVLENGFAVLANYQRKHPNNSRLFSKQRPDAWPKCVGWLLKEESMAKIDVLFQGLFAIGLACSYCPLAAQRVRNAGGLTLTEKVLAVHGETPREPSVSSTTDSKLATLQQFSEGLRVLLLKSQEDELAEQAAAALKAEAAAAAAAAKAAEKAAVAEKTAKKETKTKEKKIETVSKVQEGEKEANLVDAPKQEETEKVLDIKAQEADAADAAAAAAPEEKVASAAAEGTAKEEGDTPKETEQDASNENEKEGSTRLTEKTEAIEAHPN